MAWSSIPSTTSRSAGVKLGIHLPDRRLDSSNTERRFAHGLSILPSWNKGRVDNGNNPQPQIFDMWQRAALAISTLSLAIAGCTRTSRELPKNLSDVVVTIELEQNSSARVSRDTIRAVLATSEGTVIEREDLQIKVNGTRMQFKVWQGNYYDRHPYYYIANDAHEGISILPQKDYNFVLVMPDGSSHQLTTLKTPIAVSLDQFGFVRIPSSPPAAAFTWNDLAGPMRLSIARSEQIPDAAGGWVSMSGHPRNDDALHRTIGPGWFRPRSGKWLLPQRFLISSPKRQLVSLEAWIQTETMAPVAQPFSRKSSATASRKLELTLEWP